MTFPDVQRVAHWQDQSTVKLAVSRPSSSRVLETSAKTFEERARSASTSITTDLTLRSGGPAAAGTRPSHRTWARRLTSRRPISSGWTRPLRFGRSTMRNGFGITLPNPRDMGVNRSRRDGVVVSWRRAIPLSRVANKIIKPVRWPSGAFPQRLRNFDGHPGLLPRGTSSNPPSNHGDVQAFRRPRRRVGTRLRRMTVWTESCQLTPQRPLEGSVGSATNDRDRMLPCRFAVSSSPRRSRTSGEASRGPMDNPEEQKGSHSCRTMPYLVPLGRFRRGTHLPSCR